MQVRTCTASQRPFFRFVVVFFAALLRGFFFAVRGVGVWGARRVTSPAVAPGFQGTSVPPPDAVLGSADRFRDRIFPTASPRGSYSVVVRLRADPLVVRPQPEAAVLVADERT